MMVSALIMKDASGAPGSPTVPRIGWQVKHTAYRWGGSTISRFTVNGIIDTEIIFPTALNITACCFGG